MQSRLAMDLVLQNKKNKLRLENELLTMYIKLNTELLHFNFLNYIRRVYTWSIRADLRIRQNNLNKQSSFADNFCSFLRRNIVFNFQPGYDMPGSCSPWRSYSGTRNNIVLRYAAKHSHVLTVNIEYCQVIPIYVNKSYFTLSFAI